MVVKRPEDVDVQFDFFHENDRPFELANMAEVHHRRQIYAQFCKYRHYTRHAVVLAAV